MSRTASNAAETDRPRSDRQELRDPHIDALSVQAFDCDRSISVGSGVALCQRVADRRHTYVTRSVCEKATLADLASR